MNEFENVAVVKKANVYFDGKVNSRMVKFADGSTKTLGFMMPGEYQFNTADPEVMEIMSGETEVMLAGSDQWLQVKGGEIFEVAGNSGFTIKAITPTDYCCSFIK